MNSIFAKILFDLQNHIMASMPEIRQVDQYLGQDQTDIRPALALPAVLIDFENTEYEQSGCGSQFALATISVRLCHANFTTTLPKASVPASSAGGSYPLREASMKAYELEQKLVNTIHLWEPSDQYCQPLVRTADQSENRNDIGLRIRTIAFTTAFEVDNVYVAPITP